MYCQLHLRFFSIGLQIWYLNESVHFMLFHVVGKHFSTNPGQSIELIYLHQE